MEQTSIYDGNPPSIASSDTSVAAAQSVKQFTPKTRNKVELAIRMNSSYGMTDDEIEDYLGMRHQSASARRRELVLMGRVVDSGRRRTTRSGRKAAVWVVVEE